MRRLSVLTFCICAAMAPARAQQTLVGGFSGTNADSSCGNAGQSTFGGALNAVVQPSLSSLAASGGSFTGSANGAGISNDCGDIDTISVTLAITGTVSPGGSVSFTVTGTGSGAKGGGGATISGSGTGTTSSTVTTLSSTFNATDSGGGVNTGTLTLASLSPSSLTGSFTAEGPDYCVQPDGSMTVAQFTASALVLAGTQPALSSLTTGGGTFTGTLSGGGTQTVACPGQPTGFNVSGSLTGTVSPGGGVSWAYTLNVMNTDGSGTALTGSGSGTTSMLVANGSFSDPTGNAGPTLYSVVLSGVGAQSTLPPLQVPGGGGTSQIALPSGTVGAAYTQNLPVSGGTAPYNWTIAGGAIPPGLTLSSNGFLSGTPSQPGGALFIARVTDATGAFSSSAFALIVTPQSFTLTTTSLPNGIVGTPYPAQVLTASGGTPPYTFQIAGTLPAGLTFSNGSISGTPTAAGTSMLAVTVTDSSPTAQTASGQLSLTIGSAHTDLLLSQSSVTFTVPNSATVLPAAVRVSVQSNTPSQIIDYSVAVTPAVPWLSVQSGGSTPGALTVGLTRQALQLTADANTSVVLTCAAGSPCAGNSQTIAVSLNVVTAAPQLVVTTPSLSFIASSVNPQVVAQTFGIANRGGGSIFINALTAADKFVSIVGNPGSLEGGPAFYGTVFVNPAGLSPGFYRSSFSIGTSLRNITIPITVLVVPGATMTLSQAGVLFIAQQGSLPGNASGSFEVGVTNSNSTVSFNAAVLPGASWLTLNTTNGTSTAANPGSVSFTINSAAASLTPGAYYGSIQVSSPNVVDSPQTFVVVLNVISAATAVTPSPQPAGLLFIASSGTPAAQTVKVFAGTSASVPFQAASDSAWLSVTPATGNTSSTSPASTSVSVDANGLTAGVYNGGVSYSLSGAGVRTVNVTLIVVTPAVSADRPGVNLNSPVSHAAAACTPANLVPVETALPNSFSQPAAWPTPLTVMLLDDCGQPVTNGQVVAAFSNGDPPLELPPTDTTTGTYSATWAPGNTAQQVAITLNLSATNFPTITTQLAGQVTPNAAPIVFPSGTINAFAIAAEPGVPFAPGTIVAIYGSNLASQADLPGVIPLLDTVNQTSVIIGGITAPLYYVSPGQINAQIPFELAAGNPYQLIVNANGALSTPYPIELVPDAPGIAQYAGGDIIAQHQDLSLVTESSPATPAEVLTIYLAGMGLTDQTVASGTASPSASLASDLDAPTLTLNGTPVTNISFAGLTPTLVGLYQMNFQVPPETPDGDLSLVVIQASGVSNSTVLPVHH